MKASNQIEIAGTFETIFELAANVARWPEILPHYRWVKILDPQPAEMTVEMAARHKGIPLWWRARQRVRRSEHRIEFTHIQGITKGMEVQWTFDPLGAKPNVWLVQIHHQFNPSWPPLIGPWIAENVIGKQFVHQVANKTLNRIKMLAENSL